MAPPPPPPARRARGHYSPLVCTRCRARKIKCLLPPTVTCASPSAQRQPIDQACQRCRQNGFDCIVDSTILGRPTRGSTGRTDMRVHNEDAEAPDQASSPYTGEYLLSRPYDSSSPPKIPSAEVSEALSTPLRFLAVLLGRHPAFAKRLPMPQSFSSSLPGADIVPLDLIDHLDSRLGWHRLYYPYIPSLRALHDRLRVHPVPTSSVGLFTLLCDMALESAPGLPQRHLKLRSGLQTALYHHGNAVLVHPPAHRDTVTFLQLVAEYRPLALCSSHLAASSSLTDSSYYTLARRAASQIGLDRSFAYLAEGGDEAITSDMVLETVQWLHLVMSEGYAGLVMGRSDVRTDWLTSIEPTVDRLEHLLFNRNVVPAAARWRVMSLIIAIRSARTRLEMFQSWRDLSALQAIIDLDHTNGLIFRTACTALLASDTGTSTDAGPNSNRSPTVLALLDAELHKQHLSIKMTAMFFAVMAASYFREHAHFDPAEIAQMSDHIEDHLKTPLELDHVHKFMMVHGHSTADEIEKQLTDFIHLCEDSHTSDVPYVPPTKTAAAEVLHSAYHLVQQNAARLKGWGGFHERVDTHLIVIKECGRRLESLANGGTVGEGNVLAGASLLVMDLHGILSTWKRRWNHDAASVFSIETQSNQASGRSQSSGVDAPRLHEGVPLLKDPPVPPIANADPSASFASNDSAHPPTATAWADDFFASWDRWPQPEDIDFSQFIDFDYDPTAPT